MPAEQSFEDRVAAVEEAIAEIRRRFCAAQPAADWIEGFKGAFRDDPDFAEVVRLGREYRDSDRPALHEAGDTGTRRTFFEDWTV